MINKLNYFGVEKGYHKYPMLSLASFLEPTYSVSTNTLFSLITDHYFGAAPYYSRKRVNDYLDMVEKRLCVETRITNKDKYIWAIEDTREKIKVLYKDRIKFLKEKYMKYYKDEMTFEEYVKWCDEEEDKTFSYYDLTNSCLGKRYTEAYIQMQSERLKENYEINMKHFESLDEKDFNKTLNKFLKNNDGFVEITDLNDVRNKIGYYIMVLDRYKQVYVGVADDICGRIIEHWSKTKQFDRRVFGKPETSKLSIDSFGMLDTTRIFVKIDLFAKEGDQSLENYYIHQFPNKYVTNRTEGGYLELGPITVLKR